MEKQLRIPSNISYIKEIEKLVDELASEINIDNSIYGNFLISLIEAVNNSIIHGNKQNENKYVNIVISNNDQELKVIVEDEGDGFDYKNLPDPTNPDNIQKVNGRGIFLMQKLSDKCEFLDNGSKVELKFNLQ